MKRTAILLCLVGMLASVFAKDKPSIALEIGAVGTEGQYANRTTIYVGNEAQPIYIPYTRTIFNPDIHLGVDVPLVDIKENITFGIKVGYDFSFDTYGYDKNGNSQWYSSSDTAFKHDFSVLPEIIFTKDVFTFAVATGFCVELNFHTDTTKSAYESSRSTSTSKTTEEETILQFFWISDFEVKYRLTSHFSLVGDIAFSVAMITYQLSFDSTSTDTYNGTTTIYADADSSYTYGGRFPLYISPKIGICYTF